MTRAQLIERLEMELSTGMPPKRVRPPASQLLAHLVELVREALGE